MAERHVLYFTSDEHALYRSSAGALELVARYQDDEAGVAAFRDYLRGRRGVLFSIVADLAGEDFHEDQIPALRGADREAIVQRRLAQRYRDTRLSAALPLGSVASGERQNERLLLASFTNTQQFTPWLNALEEAGARLTGVFSVPLLAPALASQLRMRAGRCLVVSANRAGLRQCFVEGGRLRFARLERTLDMAPQALALFVRSETMRLVQYLSTLRALPRDGPAIQVLVIAPAGQRAAFEQLLVSDARLVFRTVDADEALRAVGLRRTPDGTLAEALYLRLAARKPPREQFASREERRGYIVWQLQRAIVAAGALGFAACVLLAGARWLDAYTVRQEAVAQLQDARAAEQQYKRITAAFPVTQTTTENLKLAVVEFRRIAERSASPEGAFVHVSRVLGQFPQMELDSLSWSVERKRDAKPAATPAPAAAAAEGSVKPAAAADLAEMLEVSGRVNATQRNDYRGITAQVQRFANALGGSSGYVVAHMQLPFDITSQGTLTGDIGGGDTGDAPRFTVVLSRALK
jgi:hypothetical protein